MCKIENLKYKIFLITFKIDVFQSMCDSIYQDIGYFNAY
jgi:hypothetical protein